MANPEEPRGEAEDTDVHSIKGPFTFFLLESCYIEGGVWETTKSGLKGIGFLLVI